MRRRDYSRPTRKTTRHTRLIVGLTSSARPQKSRIRAVIENSTHPTFAIDCQCLTPPRASYASCHSAQHKHQRTRLWNIRRSCQNKRCKCTRSRDFQLPNLRVVLQENGHGRIPGHRVTVEVVHTGRKVVGRHRTSRRTQRSGKRRSSQGVIIRLLAVSNARRRNDSFWPAPLSKSPKTK